MNDERWFEMSDDEELLAVCMKSLHAELDLLSKLPGIVTDYDELRLEGGSFEARLPLDVTEQFVDKLSDEEVWALMEAPVVAIVAEVVLEYVSADCRADIVAALSSTANALFP